MSILAQSSLTFNRTYLLKVLVQRIIPLMKKCKLTEKNMSNKHFFKTEQAIFIAYCKFRDYPSARRIATDARISRSTLYRHHCSAQNIPRDYENLITATYRRRVKELIRREVPPKILFLRTLIFISRHKKVFNALFIEGRKEVIKQMLSELKPSIISIWHNRNSLSKAYNIYENEVLGVIEVWSKCDFSSVKLNKTLNDILYLTRTAPKRLAPLGE